MFATYFQLGVEHILDIDGYDHILFIASLACLWGFLTTRQILILITAFTLGHCLTLALSGLSFININPLLIEKLIPATIIASCIDNLLQLMRKQKFNPKYLLVIFFGLIHGLGFSNYFKAIIGREDSLVMTLFSFNLGVEVAQVIIILLMIIVIFLLSKIGIKHKHIVGVCSMVIMLIAFGLYL